MLPVRRSSLLKIILTGALVATAVPAFAQDRALNPLQVSEALKAGCTVQQTHLPAGKIGTAPAIIRCSETQVAKADTNKLAARSIPARESVD